MASVFTARCARCGHDGHYSHCCTLTECKRVIRECIAAVDAEGWGNSIPLGMSEAMFASAVKDKFLYALTDLLAREQSIPLEEKP